MVMHAPQRATLPGLPQAVTIYEVGASAGRLGGCPQSSTGNLATEDLVWQLEGLGIDTGVNLESLVRTSTWMAGILGRRSPSRTLRVLTDVLGGCDG
jgi:hydroxymethylglutaryl-CoA lyase